MGILLNLLLKQLKNYIMHNKFKCFVVGSVIGLMVIPYIFMFLIMPSDFSGSSPMIDIFPMAFLAASLFTVLGFVGAETLMISKAEVNMFFVAPIKEQKIMSYVIIKNSYQLLIILLVFTGFNLSFIMPYYQIPNNRFIFLLLWQLLLLITTNFFSIFLFIVKKKSAFIFYGILFISVAAAAIAGALFLANMPSFNSILQEFNQFMSNPAWGYIPIVGWLANVTALFYGFDTKAVISIVLLIAINIAFFFSPEYIKNIALPEAMSSASEKYIKQVQKTKSGNSIRLKTKNVKDSNEIEGKGAAAIISKQWLDYKRNSRFFFSSSVINQFVIMVIYVGIYRFNSSNEHIENPGDLNVMVTTALTLIVVITLISLLTSSEISKDVNHPMIMLIPEKPYKKLLAISVMQNLENIIKMFSIMVFAYFLDIDLLSSVFLGFIYFLCVSTASYVDMFFNAVFKDNVLGILRGLFGSVTKTLILVIYGVVYAGISYLLSRNSEFTIISFPALLIIITLSILIDFVFILASQSVMINIEK